MGVVGPPDAFKRLLEALEADGIRCMMIGMSAAIAQGVMGATIDVEVWVDLPPRHYMRVQNIAQSAGAVIAANTVVYLEDGTPVNFVYQVTGLHSFDLNSSMPVSYDCVGGKDLCWTSRASRPVDRPSAGTRIYSTSD